MTRPVASNAAMAPSYSALSREGRAVVPMSDMLKAVQSSSGYVQGKLMEHYESLNRRRVPQAFAVLGGSRAEYGDARAPDAKSG